MTGRSDALLAGQVASFADYKPSGGGGDSSGGGGKEAAPAESSQDQKPAEPADSSNGGSGGGGGGGSGGDWPPHSVMGLPSLSPTMSQGMLEMTYPAS